MGAGMVQDKTMWDKGKDPILQHCPSLLPSLGVTLRYILLLNIFLLEVNFNKNIIGLKFLLILYMLA